MYELARYIGLITVSAGALALLLSQRERRKRNISQWSVVIITGCDSGLGFNLARLCYRLGFIVFAGCLRADSDGAKQLLELDRESRSSQQAPKKNDRIIPRMHIVDDLDITREERIAFALKRVKDFLRQNPQSEFFALINNAGVMCFGEFEWQRPAHIEKQLMVNLLGTMRITSAFLPLIRTQRARIVNITSHCALKALPGSSVYCASKAGLRFWSEALRIEQAPYGVRVVNFIPGSLVEHTNIFAIQGQYTNEMRQGFSPEQAAFYGEYFEEYSAYLAFISGPKAVQALPDRHPVLVQFTRALLDEPPRWGATYKWEPWRYRYYYYLFRLAPPGPIDDWLVQRFVSMPRYRKPIVKKSAA